MNGVVSIFLLKARLDEREGVDIFVESTPEKSNSLGSLCRWNSWQLEINRNAVVLGYYIGEDNSRRI